MVLSAPVTNAGRLYQVGNSLTWDSQPGGIDAIAEGRGVAHTFGHHIPCSSSLTTIAGNPGSTCITSPAPYGTYTNALPNYPWDAVTLQLFPDGNATVGSEIDAAVELIELARQHSGNAGTTFYLYQGWAARDNILTTWTSETTPAETDPVRLERGTMRYILAQVRTATDARVHMIPTGEVMYELSQAVNRGEIPGLDDHASDVYRDELHASYGAGRYAAGATVYASMYGDDLSGVTKPAGFYTDTLAPDTVAAINALVADVVSNYADVEPIPEPGALGLLMAGGLAVLRRRR